MDRTQARLVQGEVLKAVEEVYARHGMKVTRSSGSFDTGSLRLTITATSTDPALDPKVTDWKRYARAFFLPEDALGKTITYGGKAYRIDGLVPSRRKYPVAATRLDTNKGMLLTVDGVQRALGLDPFSGEPLR